MGRHIPSMLYACMKMALCDLAPLIKKVESISSLIWKLITSISTNIINPPRFENVSLKEEEEGCGGNLIFLAWNKPRISSAPQEPMMPTRAVADSKCLQGQSWRDSRTCLTDKSEGMRTHQCCGITLLRAVNICCSHWFIIKAALAYSKAEYSLVGKSNWIHEERRAESREKQARCPRNKSTGKATRHMAKHRLMEMG